MDISLKKKTVSGVICAPPSKSVYHRALICAALSKGETKITPLSTSDDILSTINALKAIGIKITKEVDGYTVFGGTFNKSAQIDLKESGSTFRFMLPLCSALGINTKFTGAERLSQRPIKELCDVLEKGGITFTSYTLPMEIKGKLTANNLSVKGSISSQFVTGLIFAVCAIGRGMVSVTDNLLSAPYIDITLDVIKKFNITIEKEGLNFLIPSNCQLISPRNFEVECDYSNTAFLLASGIINKGDTPLTIQNLNSSSLQGDKEIINILKRFGAKIDTNDKHITVYPSNLKAVDIDATHIPDLVPIISVVAAASVGVTKISGVERLKDKESNRIVTTIDMINNLGGNAYYQNDSIIIEGIGCLYGGVVDSCNDHRIAMSASVASLICENEVIIKGAEAVNKSYPDFYDVFDKLTKKV